jgi:hypothetical protein
MREARRLRDAYRTLRARQSSEDLLQGRVDDDAVALLDGTRDSGEQQIDESLPEASVRRCG